ncbi:MAG: GIY-YIG nuclease family protein [Salinivirgaceae bacterium]|nr:GIY-YIG nuclease family protein [Salinivirgaceae bacterium]
MERYFVYILYSQAIDKYYIGETVDLNNRLEEHISHTFCGSFTTRSTDWKIYLVMECQSRTQARLVESHIKKMKSKSYIQNLKKYPELREKLILKYHNSQC